MKWSLVVSICISLVISDVEYLYTCLLAICILSLKKCLLKSLVHYWIRPFVFWGSFCLYLLLLSSPCPYHQLIGEHTGGGEIRVLWWLRSRNGEENRNFISTRSRGKKVLKRIWARFTWHNVFRLKRLYTPTGDPGDHNCKCVYFHFHSTQSII